MTLKEIANSIKCLKSMCADLTDVHNNFDVSTETEDSYYYALTDAIKDFNTLQNTWYCTLYCVNHVYKLKFS